MPTFMPDENLTLETLGWNETLERSFASFRQQGLEPARVAVEDKHHFVLFNAEVPLIGKISGKLRHQAASPADLPKVGDWVAFKVLPNEEKALIHHVLPRRTKLSRKGTGRETVEQVLVTNVDLAFVVQALDRSFNLALLQRHLAMVVEGGVKPVVVLNKADLCDDVQAKLAALEAVAADAPVVAVSAKTGRASDRLTEYIRPRETIVFIGASGVGKSSLINQLCGEEVQATMEVRERDDKGRHMTSWRELIVLPNGGLVIDTPGMREFQMWLAGGEGGLEVFADIEALALRCHFRRCSHTVEQRCALRAAVEQGKLPRERFENYLKLKRELNFLEAAAQQRLWMEQKRRARAGRAKARGTDC